LKPNSIQIIVANRRHEEDLVGRLLDKEETKWEVVLLPFFAEENDILGRQVGERLWPEWFTAEMAEDIKCLPARTQAGLYQQRPAPEEGDYFKKDWILSYTKEEHDSLMKLSPRIYGAGDWAVSEEKDANKTCLGGCALDEDGTMYILPDIYWKSSSPKEVCDSFVDFLRRRDPMAFWSEKGHISKAWGPFLREQMRNEEVYNNIIEVTPAKAKDVRARSIQGRMSMRKVKFPTWTSWWPKAQHELLTFPGGKTDDFVDMIALLGAGVNSMVRTSRAQIPIEEKVDVPFRPTMSWIRESDRANNPRYAVKYNDR